MNTRIQVDILYRMVYMIDLVKEQIRTYAGIELSITGRYLYEWSRY